MTGCGFAHQSSTFAQIHYGDLLLGVRHANLASSDAGAPIGHMSTMQSVNMQLNWVFVVSLHYGARRRDCALGNNPRLKSNENLLFSQEYEVSLLHLYNPIFLV